MDIVRQKHCKMHMPDYGLWIHFETYVEYLNKYHMKTFMCGNDMESIHYNDDIMDTMAFQITSLTIVYSIVYSGADQRKHQRSASLAFVRGIHRWLVNFPHKWPVTRKMFAFDDVIMFKLVEYTAGYTVQLCGWPQLSHWRDLKNGK